MPARVVVPSQSTTSRILANVQRVPGMPKSFGSRRRTWRSASWAVGFDGYRGGKNGLAPASGPDRETGQSRALIAVEPAIDAVGITFLQQTIARDVRGEPAVGDFADRRGPLADVRFRMHANRRFKEGALLIRQIVLPIHLALPAVATRPPKRQVAALHTTV